VLSPSYVTRMDSLASLAFCLRSSYPRSMPSELPLRKMSSSPHRCYSTESLTSSPNISVEFLDYHLEWNQLMSPSTFKIKPTAGEAVGAGWRISPPPFLLPNLSIDPPRWIFNIIIIICLPLVLCLTHGGPQYLIGWTSTFNDGSMLGEDASQAIVASYVDSFYSISAPIGAILTWHLSSWASSFPCHHPVLSSFQDHSHFGLRLRWGAPPRGVCFVVQRKRDEELPNIRRLIWCRDGVYLWWISHACTGVYRLMLISVVWNPLFHAIMGRDCWLGELF